MSFRIVLPGKLREPIAEPLPVLRDELSNLTYAIRLLEEVYWASLWHIFIQEDRYDLCIEDVLCVWEEIPALLQQTLNPDEPPAMFYFYEQGVEMAILAKVVSPDEVSLSVERYAKKPRTSKDYRVPGKQFFDEWSQFVDTMIQLLVENYFIENDDPSIREYLDRMPQT